MLARFLILTLLSLQAWATVFLDIEITHEKVLGDKVILKSELMSSELVYNKKEISLQMQNGILIKLVPLFNEIDNAFDSNTPIKIQGLIQNTTSAKAKPKVFDLSLMVNNPGDLEFSSGDGQKTKVKITPKAK